MTKDRTKKFIRPRIIIVDDCSEEVIDDPTIEEFMKILKKIPQKNGS